MNKPARSLSFAVGMAAIILLIIAAVQVAGSGQKPAQTTQPSLSADDLRRNLPDIIAAMKGINSFSMTTVRDPWRISGTAPGIDELAWDVQGQNVQWTHITTPTYPITIVHEDLWLGTDHYRKDASDQIGGKWLLLHDYTWSTAGVVDYLTRVQVIPAANDPNQYQQTGTETINGVVCRVYSSIPPTRDPSGFGHTNSHTYWVGVQDNIVHQSSLVQASEAGALREQHTLDQINTLPPITPPPSEQVVLTTPAPPSPTPLLTPLPPR